MPEIKKIGLITGGGDCGGLNGVIKGAATMANSLGIGCYAIPNGYSGLYNLVDFDRLVQLTRRRTDEMNINLAGSEIGHSRVKIKKIADEKKYQRIKAGLRKFGINALVIGGGDDTGSVMLDLDQQGIACVHVPKTMDLDLQTYSVGADSTINKIAGFVNDLKTTATTHSRIVVLEVFGRYAGHTAFRGGIAGGADAVLIPEIPVDFDILYRHAKECFMQRVINSDVGKGKYIIVVAEGIKDASGKEIVDEDAGKDAFGHKKLAGAGKYVCQELDKRLKTDSEITKFMKNSHTFIEDINTAPEIRWVAPGHLVRCGHSSAYDVNFGMESGAAAVILLKQGISGVTVVGVCGKEIRYIKTSDAIKQRYVDLDRVAFYESLGICFGRNKAKFLPKFKETDSRPERYM